MAYTYKVGGIQLIADNPVSPSCVSKLATAMSKAKKVASRALLVTSKALEIAPKGPGPDLLDRLGYLEPRFQRHLFVHFRITKEVDFPSFLAFLRRLNKALFYLVEGMNSPDLRLAEYGHHRFAPRDASAKAYVRMPVTWAVQRATGECLNIDPSSFKNKNDVNIRFDRVDSYLPGDLVDTLIHECTHKYLGTVDRCISGLPFQDYEDYEKTWREAGVEPPLGPLAQLDTDQALTDAYVITNYCLHLPDVDLDEYLAGMRQTDRVIGEPESNQRVFDSIGNADL